MTDFERAVATRLKQLGFPKPETEYKLFQSRKFRSDFAWPKYKIALEAEGGAYTQGRHTRGQGFENDCEKYSLAASEGWLVIRCTPRHVEDGRVWIWLEEAFDLRKAEADWKRAYAQLHEDYEWQANRIQELELEQAS